MHRMLRRWLLYVGQKGIVSDDSFPSKEAEGKLQMGCQSLGANKPRRLRVYQKQDLLRLGYQEEQGRLCLWVFKVSLLTTSGDITNVVVCSNCI